MFSKGPQKPIEAGKCNADAGTYEKIVGTLVSAYSAGRGSPASWGARALAQTDIGEGRFPYLPGRNELHPYKNNSATPYAQSLHQRIRSRPGRPSCITLPEV